MICPKCRKSLPAGASSCPRCAGTRPRTAHPVAPRRGNHLVFWGIAAGLVLILGAIWVTLALTAKAKGERLLAEGAQLEKEREKAKPRAPAEKPSPPARPDKVDRVSEPPSPPRRRFPENDPPPPPEPPARTQVDREIKLPAPGTYTGGPFFSPIEECGWQVEVTSLEGDVATRTIRIEKEGSFTPAEEKELKQNAKPVGGGKTLVERGTAKPGETYYYAVRNVGQGPVRARVVVRLIRKGIPYPDPLPAKGAAPSAGPSAPRVHTDARLGFSMRIPDGWRVVPSGDPQVPLEMLLEGDEGTNFNLTAGPADSTLAGGKGSWEMQHRVVIEGVRKATGKAVVPLREERGSCSGYPAFLSSFSCTVEGVSKSQLHYCVATPTAFYALTWTTTTAQFVKMEPLFEQTSKAFTISRP